MDDSFNLGFSKSGVIGQEPCSGGIVARPYLNSLAISPHSTKTEESTRFAATNRIKHLEDCEWSRGGLIDAA